VTGFCVINLQLITKNCTQVLRENAKHWDEKLQLSSQSSLQELFLQGETTMAMAPQLQLQRHRHKHSLHPRILHPDAILRRWHKATYLDWFNFLSTSSSSTSFSTNGKVRRLHIH
jgi:hypothetical protein